MVEVHLRGHLISGPALHLESQLEIPARVRLPPRRDRGCSGASSAAVFGGRARDFPPTAAEYEPRATPRALYDRRSHRSKTRKKQIISP